LFVTTPQKKVHIKMAKKRAREADGATEASDKMAVDGDGSSDDEVSGIANSGLFDVPGTDRLYRTLTWST
jgi:hypothetical protein